MTGILMDFPSLVPHSILGAPERHYATTLRDIQDLEDQLRVLCTLVGHDYRTFESPVLGGTGRIRCCRVCQGWHYF